MKLLIKKTPPPGGGDETPSTPVTSDTMTKWNKLIDFAKAKGYAGLPDLDHNPVLRQKVFDEYNKANPNDTIPQEMVKPIQNEIQNYKQKALSDIKANPGTYAGDPNSFMQGISQVDGIFGQKTSQWKFPQTYVDAAKTKSIGFAPQVDRSKLLQILKTQ
jgi:hypothetical protein